VIERDHDAVRVALLEPGGDGYGAPGEREQPQQRGHDSETTDCGGG